MEGLRIELGGERLNLIGIDAELAGNEPLANVKVFQIYRWGRLNFVIPGHYASIAKLMFGLRESCFFVRPRAARNVRVQLILRITPVLGPVAKNALRPIF
jgi:hypothetical protein